MTFHHCQMVVEDRSASVNDLACVAVVGGDYHIFVVKPTDLETACELYHGRFCLQLLAQLQDPYPQRVSKAMEQCSQKKTKVCLAYTLDHGT